MSRPKITSREQAYIWLCKMCNPQREDIEKFIDTVIKCDGHMGLSSDELKYLEECKVDVWLERIILEEE